MSAKPDKPEQMETVTLDYSESGGNVKIHVVRKLTKTQREEVLSGVRALI